MYTFDKLALPHPAAELYRWAAMEYSTTQRPAEGEITMDCCQCQGIEAWFDAKYVSKKVETYRKRGPQKTTRILIESLKARDIQGMTLLDIGGGVGAILHELIKAGVSSGANVEASAAYVEACRQEAVRQAHADRVLTHHGNFVDMAQDIPSSDIVTLDRVICCYHDMAALVGMSLAKCRRFYGLVYPRDLWWVKAGNFLYYNLRSWLRRNPFRSFIHSTQAVETLVQTKGLERVFFRESGPWQIALYARGG